MVIDQYTDLYGVIGKPVRHSLGPAMHNAAFREKAVNAVYLAFEAADAGDCVKGVRSLGIRGLSVTIPFKTDIIPFLDEVDDLALRIGAVNTVVNKDGSLRGYNTDAAGALTALEEKTEVPGRRIVIIGAGGASRAIGYILKEKGATVIVSNRSHERGRALCRDLDCEFIHPDILHDVNADIIINTTPVGMSPDIDKSPVPEKIFKKGMVAMDIIYNPLETRFLAAAKARECEIVNGLSMFVFQGAEQFRLWTGLEAPMDVMTAAVKEVLGNS